ncbi:MAG: hypothetical protein JKY63_02625 [Rhodobiaceae bacterium]|nr:hypothetical protein [Rhodobiaceae bacterium]
MKIDQLSFAFAAVILALTIILGVLLGLDAAGHPWEEQHPVRWFFRDFGGIIAALVALLAASLTVKAMRKQTADAIVAADKRIVLEHAAELRVTWYEMVNLYVLSQSWVSAVLGKLDAAHQRGVVDKVKLHTTLTNNLRQIEPMPAANAVPHGRMHPSLRTAVLGSKAALDVWVVQSLDTNGVAASVSTGLQQWLERFEIAEAGMARSMMLLITVCSYLEDHAEMPNSQAAMSIIEQATTASFEDHGIYFMAGQHLIDRGFRQPPADEPNA